MWRPGPPRPWVQLPQFGLAASQHCALITNKHTYDQADTLRSTGRHSCINAEIGCGESRGTGFSPAVSLGAGYTWI